MHYSFQTSLSIISHNEPSCISGHLICPLISLLISFPRSLCMKGFLPIIYDPLSPHRWNAHLPHTQTILISSSSMLSWDSMSIIVTLIYIQISDILSVQSTLTLSNSISLGFTFLIYKSKQVKEFNCLFKKYFTNTHLMQGTFLCADDLTIKKKLSALL